MVSHPFDPDDDFPFDGPVAAQADGPGPERPSRPAGAAGPAPSAGASAAGSGPERPSRPAGAPGPAWSAGASAAGPAGRPPGVPAPETPGSAPLGDDDEGEGGQSDWERVREAAWRVGQRARRHERVLHTRISEELAEDLRRAADDLRVPVSNLVRNVLEEAFGAVERVSDEVGSLLEEVLAEADGARHDVRRLRRGLRRLARRGRHRARRRFGDAGDEPFSDADDDFARPGDADAPPPAAAPATPATPAAPAAAGAGAAEATREERVETALREAGAREQVFRPRGAELPFAEVLGWQPLRLNAAAACACGERQLAAGEEAFVAVTERGLSRTFLCGTCMRARGGA